MVYVCDYENEEWRPVVGWEKFYEASSLGRIKRLERETVTRGGNIKVLPEMIMSSKPCADGYIKIQLKRNGERKVTKACRIIAEAFIPNPEGFSSVVHLNGNRSDCRVENLAWRPRGVHPRLGRKWQPEEQPDRLDDLLAAHTLPGEEWRDIHGYEGLYLASNFGRILSVPRPKAKSGILVPAVAGNGYCHVTLCKNGALEVANVHRIIADTFLDNPNGYQYVNHIDEDKTNNFLANLEFCDAKYNINYGTGTERRSLSRRMRAIHGDAVSYYDESSDTELRGRHQRKPILRYDIDGVLLDRWPSIQEASKGTGVSSASISKACHRDGAYNTDGISCGYRWDFEGVDYGEAS